MSHRNCDAFDNSHVQYISDTLHISLDQYLTTDVYNIPNMQNMRFFCCSVYVKRNYVRLCEKYEILATFMRYYMYMKITFVHVCEILWNDSDDTVCPSPIFNEGLGKAINTESRVLVWMQTKTRRPACASIRSNKRILLFVL